MTGNDGIYAHLLKADTNVMLDLTGKDSINAALYYCLNRIFIKGTALDKYPSDLVFGIIDRDYAAAIRVPQRPYGNNP